MEYVQERVTTLHDLADPAPGAPVDRASVVVPMTDREYAGLAAERVLSELERIEPAQVVVPLRASPGRVDAFREWLEGFDLPLSILWCNGPGVESLLESRGLGGPGGKGRDVWLAFGVAAREDAVVVHDADAKNYTGAHVSRLLFPLTLGYEFSKGYYARVENGRLYGRLLRLFVAPLVRALLDEYDASVLAYLDAFRYALSGEIALTSELAKSIRAEPRWGLEVGALGDAFTFAGFDGSAQVDLGIHEHDHRAIGGPTGLSDMSGQVGAALFRVVEDHDVEPEYDRLRESYAETAAHFVRGYVADSAFNGLSYDAVGEHEQIRAYARAVAPPDSDPRLPAWSDAPITPSELLHAAEGDLRTVQ